MSYLKGVGGTRQTPQSEEIPGAGQVPNSAGGYAWGVDSLTRLRRFLVLGSEGGSYYASERALTRENAEAVRAALAEHGTSAVDEIVAVSEGGRAPKNDPAIFALALAAADPNEPTRKAALAALPRVCRIGTHLFHFNEYVEQFRGRGPALNRAVREWYTREDVGALAYQIVKYRQRDGWSHRDLLRLVKPKPPTASHGALYRFAVGKAPDLDGAYPEAVHAYGEAQAAETPQVTASVIRAYGSVLPREALKPEHLASREAWEALFEVGMPMTALIRNLPTMTRVGLLAPMSSVATAVAERITNGDELRKSRVHPLSILTAHLTYAAGRSIRGSSTWRPVREIVDALDAAFYAAFGNVEPTGKRHLLALDVSGSMDMGEVNGVPGLTPRVASAAMALVTMATGDPYEVVAFTSQGRNISWSIRRSGIYTPPVASPSSVEGLSPLSLSPRQRLADVCAATRALSFGGTDCALPWLYATEEGREVDVAVTYTDSETWAGSIHPSQALQAYREKTGLAARAVVVGMVSNGFSIADPRDPGQLDVVGFDSAAPQVIADFAAGRI